MTDDSAAWLHCSSGLNQGIGICLDIVSRRRNLTFTYAKSVDDDLDDCINWRSSSTTSAPQFVSTPIFLPDRDSRHEVVSHLNTITTPIIHRRRTTPIPAATSSMVLCAARPHCRRTRGGPPSSFVRVDANLAAQVFTRKAGVPAAARCFCRAAALLPMPVSESARSSAFSPSLRRQRCPPARASAPAAPVPVTGQASSRVHCCALSTLHLRKPAVSSIMIMMVRRDSRFSSYYAGAPRTSSSRPLFPGLRTSSSQSSYQPE